MGSHLRICYSLVSSVLFFKLIHAQKSPVQCQPPHATVTPCIQTVQKIQIPNKCQDILLPPLPVPDPDHNKAQYLFSHS